MLQHFQCFKEGTLVACLNESGEEIRKPIESIAVGTLVLAYNEETGEQAYKPVVRLFRNTTEMWCTVSVLVNGVKTEIVSTPGHKYYLPNNVVTREVGEKEEHESYYGLSEKWVSVCNLKKGDRVLLSNGTYGIIQSVEVENLSKPETTYNFEVEDFHTYYVTESNVLVHNKCYLDPNDINYTQDSISNKFSDGRSVDDMVDALKSGTLSPDDVPALEVFKHNGNIYSINNRRLFAYKMAGVKKVPVKWVSRSSMAHAFTGNGISIFVRGGSKFL